MIEDGKSLSQILKKYGIDYNCLDNEQQEMLCEQAIPSKMIRALEFLINVLGVPAKKIEKCPSVLYLKPENLKKNYEALIAKGINREKVIGCLHILSSDLGVIEETYDYISTNYGEETFNKNVSILGVTLTRIKMLEDVFSNRMSKQALLSAAITTLRVPEISTILSICEEKGIEISSGFFQKGVGEVNEIINICLENNVEITGSVFRKSSAEVKRIIEVCKRKEIEITGSVFLKDASEIEKIVDTCRKYNISITGSVFRRDALEIEDIVSVCFELGIEISGTVFLRTADEIKKIHDVCKKYKINISANVFKKSALEIEEIASVCNKYGLEISPAVFKKSASSLEKSLKYIQENFGSSYIMPLVATIDCKHLQKVLPHLSERGTIEAVIVSPAILSLTYDDLLERESLIEKIGEDDIINGRFNSIYGLSKKRYREKKKSLNLKGVDAK